MPFLAQNPVQIVVAWDALGEPGDLSARALDALHEAELSQLRDHLVEHELVDVRLLRRPPPASAWASAITSRPRIGAATLADIPMRCVSASRVEVPDFGSTLCGPAQAPVQHTVVWLDELQRYLGGGNGLVGGVVRALLNSPHPAVIIGTLWPDLYTRYTTLPAPSGADPHAREREVLDLAAVIRIDPAFSAAEQGRTHAAASRDRRLKVALEASGYGLTQILAAAPQLVARWEDARTGSPYA